MNFFSRGKTISEWYYEKREYASFEMKGNTVPDHLIFGTDVVLKKVVFHEQI